MSEEIILKKCKGGEKRPGCGKELSLEHFRVRKNNRYETICKECESLYKHELYVANHIKENKFPEPKLGFKFCESGKKILGCGKELSLECFSISDGYTRSTCKECYKKHQIQRNELKKLNKKLKEPQPKLGFKFCKPITKRAKNKGCGQELPLDCFKINKKTGNYANICISCKAEQNAKYYQDNFNKLSDLNGQWQKDNINKVRGYGRKYRENHPDRIKDQNKRKIEKRKNDPVKKLRSNISRSIHRMLKRNNGSKAGESFIDYVDWEPDELKAHLEAQFKPWMNWDNWTEYRIKDWDDEDSTTWKWQIDHINPHVNFPYVSLDDPLLKECWALSNLRPYSAKQNIIDGARNVKRKKKSRKQKV